MGSIPIASTSKDTKMASSMRNMAGAGHLYQPPEASIQQNQMPTIPEVPQTEDALLELDHSEQSPEFVPSDFIEEQIELQVLPTVIPPKKNQSSKKKKEVHADLSVSETANTDLIEDKVDVSVSTNLVNEVPSLGTSSSKKKKNGRKK